MCRAREALGCQKYGVRSISCGWLAENAEKAEPWKLRGARSTAGVPFGQVGGAENAASAEPYRLRVANSTAGVAFGKVWLPKMLQAQHLGASGVRKCCRRSARGVQGCRKCGARSLR